MTSESKIDIDREKGNFHFDTSYAFDAGVGLSENVVRYISEVKEEEEPEAAAGFEDCEVADLRRDAENERGPESPKIVS